MHSARAHAHTHTHIYIHSEQLVSEAGEPYIPTEGKVWLPTSLLPGEEERKRMEEDHLFFLFFLFSQIINLLPLFGPFIHITSAC